ERPGKLEGKGFYEYDENGRRTGLWAGLRGELREKLGVTPVDVPDGEAATAGADLNSTATSGTSGVPTLNDLIERMLFIEALETQRCVDENVLTSDADANIGSILGIGYPAWTGGSRQFITNYARPAAAALPSDAGKDYPTSGVAGFVARAEELAAAYGERFAPVASLKG
ncbi:MAG: 3-hydroxyacyl-CoA dehydrogenase, partial [Corynebacterium sp.]